MDPEQRTESEALPLSITQRIEEVCRRFEAHWIQGQSPRLEDFLGEATGAERTELARLLLRIEREYRQRQGETPAAEEYLNRLPSEDRLVRVEGGKNLADGEGTGARSTLPVIPGYQILEELGRGGMGVVYKALQLRLNRVVALKMIRSGGRADEIELARFRTEAEALGRLRHPHIVQIHEIGDCEGAPYFSLEYCPAGSLERKLSGGPLPPLEAAQLVETLSRAIHAAHQAQVIHRDLKPANVLLLEDGTPKITDFGLARKLDEVGQTQSGAILGTPSYMAPEQAGGKSRLLEPRTDVYALGAILYECLTGRPPFRSATVADTLVQVLNEEPVPPSRLQGRIPRDLETICLRCLEKDPGKRYDTALSLAEDLGRYQRGEIITARRAGPLERGWRWSRRNPLVAGLMAALVLMLLAVAAGSTIAALQFRSQRDDLQAAREADRQNQSAISAINQIHLVTLGVGDAAGGNLGGLLDRLRQSRASIEARLAEVDHQNTKSVLRNALALIDQVERSITAIGDIEPPPGGRNPGTGPAYGVEITIPKKDGGPPEFSITAGDAVPAKEDAGLTSVKDVVDRLLEKLRPTKESAEITIQAHPDVESRVVRELTLELTRRGIKRNYLRVREKPPAPRISVDPLEKQAVSIRVKGSATQFSISIENKVLPKERWQEILERELRTWHEKGKRIILLEHDPALPIGIIVSIQERGKAAGFSDLKIVVP